MALTRWEIDEELRDRQHYRNLKARERFNESKRESMINNPGRYSPFEKKAVMDEYNQNRLRQHEMDMLKEQNSGALAIQQEKTKTAGEAARQTGLTQVEQEKLRGGYYENGVFVPGYQTILEREKMANNLTLKEKELGTQERIADRESKRRFGYFDPKTGEYVGGSDFNSVAVKAENDSDAAKANAEAALQMKALELRSKESIAQGNNETKLTVSALRAAISDKKARARLVQDILKGRYNNMTGQAWQRMTPEQQDEWIRKNSLFPDLSAGGNAPADNAGGGDAARPQEGERRTFKQGEYVFRNGQWVKAN